MSSFRKTVKRTVFYDEETGQMCFCAGNFWKTCSLRVKNNLPCRESIVSITSIERDEKDPADDAVRSLDEKLSNLTDQLRHMKDFHKI